MLHTPQIFERFRASGVSGDKRKGVGGEIYGARMADRWLRDRKELILANAARARRQLSKTFKIIEIG